MLQATRALAWTRIFRRRHGTKSCFFSFAFKQISGSEMLRTSFAALATAAVLVAFVPNQSLADGRCQQLEALKVQYAGVQLTAEQQQLKRKLVAWYSGHCTGRRVAAEN